MSKQIERAVRMVAAAKRIVAFTGAGISTPSGIPDFRSPTSGAWNQADPAVVASLHAFRRDPQPFYRWITPLLDTMFGARPNPAHRALAQLEQLGKLHAVITQNIDGLHQAAGSRTVHELHGHIRTATCIRCGRQSVANDHLPTIRTGQVPRCVCGGAIKPDVVLFDEELPRDQWNAAVDAVARCDLLLVAGTGLDVYPANGLVDLALHNGAMLMIVNYAPTWADTAADVVLHADVADVLPQVVNAVIT